MVALGLVLFQYPYKPKKRGNLDILLSFLRFVAWFGAFLLLINPEFTKNEYRLEKSHLVVLTDNSSSIEATDLEPVVQVFREADRLSEKFDLSYHSFGSNLNAADSLTFDERNTNIAKALKSLRTIYSKNNGAVVLVTDGNQTLGEDYEFYGRDQDSPIFPIVIGDTTRYEDIRVDQVNVNKYAFLKNKYPIEAHIAYNGNADISTVATVLVNGKPIYREDLDLSSTSSTKVVNTLISANTVGLKNIVVSVKALDNERNVGNNRREVALEVVDEQTNIAIIAEMPHPDIGALKKSMERNEQRSVSIKKPNVARKDLEAFDLFILYQPTPSFKDIYQYIHQKEANLFTITGPRTDWDFLNNVQSSFNKDSYNQSEEVSPILNAGFSVFDLSDFSVDDFPPLENDLGDILIQKPHEVLMNQRIRGADLKQPLLTVLGTNLEREVVLFGENIWKWRMQSYRNDRNFDNFDAFMGKLILYLSTTKVKSRFAVDYDAVYQGSQGAKLTATYFDKAFVFDANASIDLQLRNVEDGETREFPMLLKGGYYEADLSDLPAGEYNFTAKVAKENLSKSGRFSILDFNVEEQFLSSDYKKLDRLAGNSGGKSYFSTQTNDLVGDLMASDRFRPVQRSEQNVVSLVDFRFLLGIMVTALALEWFLRKYNGLI